MEVIPSFDSLGDGDWLSPRISFSHDFQVTARLSPEKESRLFSEEDFSFDFCNSLSIDLHPDDSESMISADELFMNGQLRPQLATTFLSSHETEHVLFPSSSRNIVDNPRCLSMTSDHYRAYGSVTRPCMSLTNSRCSSPSRTQSMPRTTPTSPSRAHSISSSRVQSMSRVIDSSSCRVQSMPRMLPVSGCVSSQSKSFNSGSGASTSNAATSSGSLPFSSSSSSSSSSKYSSKFKDFFKIKKSSNGKEVSTMFSSSGSAEITRECPHSSGASSCRHPSSRSFWPFSRSNSAGESKSAPVVSPLPRRSNSAGEGKTTSSSLLASSSPCKEHYKKNITSQASKHASALQPEIHSCQDSVSEIAINNAFAMCNTNVPKKGLPPLPNPTFKKSSHFLVPAHCVADAVALTNHLSAMPRQMVSYKTEDVESDSANHAEHISMSDACSSMEDLPQGHATLSANGMPLDGRPANVRSQHVRNVAQMPHRTRGLPSPGRQMRRASNSNAVRNFSRGSPGRRGVWNSPGRATGGRITIRSLERGNTLSKRPKDMLSRDSASVVLNVPMPSRRGSKSLAKPKMFGLGNLFSKKEKVARAYNVLPDGDAHLGG